MAPVSSPAASKRKGAGAEIAYHRWLLDEGHDAARLHLNGRDDEGDIHIHRGGAHLTVVEVKNCRTMNIPGWLRELDREMANTRVHRPGVVVDGYVVIRPRGVTDPAKWWRVTRTEARP